MWETLSLQLKVGILEGESLVEYGLLMESEDLLHLIRCGTSKEDCLDWINKNF